MLTDAPVIITSGSVGAGMSVVTRMNRRCSSGFKEEESRGVHTGCGRKSRREEYGTGVVEDRVSKSVHYTSVS